VHVLTIININVTTYKHNQTGVCFSAMTRTHQPLGKKYLSVLSELHDSGSRLIGLRLPLKDWRSNPSAAFYGSGAGTDSGFSAIFSAAFGAVGRARSEARKLGIQFESRTLAVDESLNEWHVDAMRASTAVSLASAMLF
jgi:hypothetical protein